MTETLSGPGILGEIDDPTLGQFGSMEMEIPFVTLTQSMFKLIGNNNVVNAKVPLFSNRQKDVRLKISRHRPF